MAGARGTDECRVVVGVCVCLQVAKHSVCILRVQVTVGVAD